MKHAAFPGAAAKHRETPDWRSAGTRARPGGGRALPGRGSNRGLVGGAGFVSGHGLPCQQWAMWLLLVIGTAAPIAAQEAAPPSEAQSGPAAVADSSLADQKFEEAMAPPPAKASAPADEPAPRAAWQELAPWIESIPQPLSPSEQIPLGIMAACAGWLALVALVRWWTSRRARLMPAVLVDGFRDLAKGQGGFDTIKASRLCQQYPSSAAQALRAGLTKVGQPEAQCEQAMRHAVRREAEQLAASASLLRLSAGVALLLGAWGTIWEAMLALHRAASAPAEQDRLRLLLQGGVLVLTPLLCGVGLALLAWVVFHVVSRRQGRHLRDVDEWTQGLAAMFAHAENRWPVDVSMPQLTETQLLPSASPGISLPDPSLSETSVQDFSLSLDPGQPAARRS